MRCQITYRKLYKGASMITLKEIAQFAGVSTSTVSRALNNDLRISLSQRQRIHQIADEHHYTKHIVKAVPASAPCGFPLRNIGMIVPEINSGYYSRLVDTAAAYFAKYSYSILLRLSCFDLQTLLLHIVGFSHLEIDGLLIVIDDAEAITDEVYQAIEKTRLPVILITAQYQPHMDYDSIYVDEKRGIREGLEHLRDRGYRRIGFVGEKMTHGRLSAFRDILQELSLPLCEELVLINSSRAEKCGYEGMKALLRANTHPDAVFAGYDQIAIGALKAIDEAGLRIPDDIAVIGFDNIVLSGYIHGGLTTIDPALEDMIAIAVRILLNRINRELETVPQQIALKPELIIRRTT